MRKRRSRQKKGYLGHRTHGRGNVKNRRGSGNRGGRGKGGMCKHKNSWITKNVPDYFGKHGFTRPVGKETKVTHLYDINQKALTGKLEKKGDRFLFDFKGKVLATGKVTVPLEIRAVSWSKSVEKKLADTGGQISELGK